MKPRIQVTRIHQLNGPDYWQADCYIQDHTLQTVGMFHDAALAKMWVKVDEVLWKDWYTAHAYNDYFKKCAERMTESAKNEPLGKNYQAAWKEVKEGRMSHKTFDLWKLREFEPRYKPTRQWKWWHWFYLPPL